MSYKQFNSVFFLILFASAAPLARAHSKNAPQMTEVIGSLEAFKKLNVKTLHEDEELQVAIARLSKADQAAVLDYNHSQGRCGGFEVLDSKPGLLPNYQTVLSDYRKIVLSDQALSLTAPFAIAKNSRIEAAINELSATNLKSTVTWLSTFKTRSARATSPNQHVLELKQRLINLTADYSFASVSEITHRQTAQKSLRVRLNGSSRPNEIVIVGGHLDSLNSSWTGSTDAPGADDNASGSANVLETLRVLLTQGQPQRTVEFFWYAAEESGLIGSSEIARRYKEATTDVIGVLQLDMTLFPGSGELTIANITDNTSPWLRDLFKQLNQHYIGARLIEDTCGYGCSDHASWYRQGYSTLLPFEAAPRHMNKKIHTANDTVNSTLSFNHSLAFTKLALAFAMQLGNSSLRSP